MLAGQGGEIRFGGQSSGGHSWALALIMHTHSWKLNAFLNPEMLSLGQKGQIGLHASLLFISLEAELTNRTWEGSSMLNDDYLT